MKTGIAVSGKGLTDYRSEQVRVAVHREVRSRGIENRPQLRRTLPPSATRISIDRLSLASRRVDPVKLKVPGATKVVRYRPISLVNACSPIDIIVVSFTRFDRIIPGKI